MGITVTQYKRNENNGSQVVAYVSFCIAEWGLHLNNCKYIRSKKGGFFIGFPSKKVEGKDNEYFPFFYFEGEARNRFQESAKKAIENYIAKLQSQSEDQNNDQAQNVDEKEPFNLF